MNQDKKEEVSDQFFILISVVLFSMVGWSRFRIPLLRFYNGHRAGIAFLLSILIIVGFYHLKKFFLKISASRDSGKRNP